MSSMIAVAVACTITLSGCFLQSLVGFVGDDGTGTIAGSVEVGFCNFDTEIPEFYGCSYSVYDDGFLVEVTSTFQLVSELGFFGILIDPLILQVPDSFTDVVGTYNNSGSDEPLVVSEVTSFPVTPSVTVQAEAGTKFLILELPEAVLQALPEGPSAIDFDLDFTAPDVFNVMVKPMFTARVELDGVTYYPPIFPCVTDFSQIPASQIPVDAGIGNLLPQFSSLITNADQYVCDEVVYDFMDSTGASTTTTTTTATATTVTTPGATTPPTTQASPSPPVDAPATSSPAVASSLPATGSSATEQVWLSISLLLLGAGLVVAATRRTRSS